MKSVVFLAEILELFLSLQLVPTTLKRTRKLNTVPRGWEILCSRFADVKWRNLTRRKSFSLESDSRDTRNGIRPKKKISNASQRELSFESVNFEDSISSLLSRSVCLRKVSANDAKRARWIVQQRSIVPRPAQLSCPSFFSHVPPPFGKRAEERARRNHRGSRNNAPRNDLFFLGEKKGKEEAEKKRGKKK